jgi:hypothetical protein
MATDDLINEDIFFSQNQFHMDTSRRAYLPFMQRNYWRRISFFLLVCKNENIITLRNKYLPNCYRAYPNHAKFEGLLSICNAELYKRLSIFIRKAAALL